MQWMKRPPCFCAGWDLKSMATDGLPESYDPDGEGMLRVSRRLPPTLPRTDPPDSYLHATINRGGKSSGIRLTPLVPPY